MPSGSDPRVYSIATDTANAAYNADMLHAEIAADATTGANASHENATGDVLEVYGVAAWSAAQQTALDAVVAAHQGTATTRAYQMFEDNTLTSTTAETFQTALQRTADPVAGGTYRLQWHFECQINPTGPVNSVGIVRFALDGTVKSNHHTALDQWSTVSGWDRAVLAEGDEPVLKLEYRRDPTVGGNDTIEIRRMKLSIEHMDEG